MDEPDEKRAPWPHPEPLGSRLLWFDGERNVTIPHVGVEPTHTDGRGTDGGYLAHLPTENGAEVYLLWDPDYPDDPPCALWLYVEHPEYGYLIDAGLSAPEGGTYSIVYDPACGGPNCAGWCAWCSPIDHQFTEYVTSPREVMDRLAWLGSLPVRVVKKAEQPTPQKGSGQ